LVLKHASTSRPSGEWNDDDFDVLADGAMVGRIIMVGRIMKATAVLVGTPWLWTLGRSWPTDQRMALLPGSVPADTQRAKESPGRA